MFGDMDRRHLPAEFCRGAGRVQLAGQPGPCGNDGAIYVVEAALHRDEHRHCVFGGALHALEFGRVHGAGGAGAGGADDFAYRGVTVLRWRAHGGVAARDGLGGPGIGQQSGPRGVREVSSVFRVARGGGALAWSCGDVLHGARGVAGEPL